LPSTERLPAVLVASAARFVPSRSSTRLPAVSPSVVVAVAPDELEAQFVGNSISIRSFSPDRNQK
jgi:hypothetical protein